MKISVLSIDGGGVRGIIPAVILQYIEEKIIEISNNSSARISDYIDFSAGTSTGSVISSMIMLPDDDGRPVYKMEDIVEAYFELADNIFQKNLWTNLKTLWGLIGPKYSSIYIEQELLRKLDHWKMKDLIKSCAFTAYDTNKRKPIIYTNHDDNKKYENYYIKDIVRGSSTIPAYFKPAYFRDGIDINTAIDGGTFANNPAMIAYIEVLKTKEITKLFDNKIDPNDMIFLSFSTGKTKLTNYNYNKIKGWGTIKWFLPILNILLQGVSEVTDYQMKKLFESYDAVDNYYRINPPILHGSSSAEDGSRTNMRRLRQDALNYVSANKDLLDEIAKKLVFRKYENE